MWGQSQASKQEAQEYFAVLELSEEEQQGMQNNNHNALAWECAWCMTEHTPGATSGICSDCMRKFPVK